MTTRHEYIEKFKEKLDEWDSDIDELEARAQRVKADIKFEAEDQMAGLRHKRDLARLKISEIRDASEEAWEDLKEGADDAWSSLKEALEHARSHFK